MYKTEMQKIGDAAEKKIAFMRQSPFSYIILSALAGIYLGFGIVLIFSVAGPIAADGGGAYLKLIMGPFFWHRPQPGYFCGIGVVYREQYGVCRWSYYQKGGVGTDHYVVYVVFYRQFFRVCFSRGTGHRRRQFDRGFTSLDP